MADTRSEDISLPCDRPPHPFPERRNNMTVNELHSEIITTNFVLARNERNNQPEKSIVSKGALATASPAERAAYFKFASRVVRPSFYFLFTGGFLLQAVAYTAEEPYVSIFAMVVMIMGLMYLHLSQVFSDREKACKEIVASSNEEEEPNSVTFSKKNLWTSLIFTLIVGAAGYAILFFALQYGIGR